MRDTNINLYLDPNRTATVTVVLRHGWRDILLTAAVCCPICAVVALLAVWLLA